MRRARISPNQKSLERVGTCSLILPRILLVVKIRAEHPAPDEYGEKTPIFRHSRGGGSPDVVPARAGNQD
jgi:hypothetical protein